MKRWTLVLLLIVGCKPNKGSVAASIGNSTGSGTQIPTAGRSDPYSRVFPAATPIPMDGHTFLTVIDASNANNLLAAAGALQGLANRPPRVPSVFTLYNRLNNSDSFWLQRLSQDYNILSNPPVLISEALINHPELTQLASDSNGLKVVVFCNGSNTCGGSRAPTTCSDSNYAIAERNVALSLSGILDALPVSCTEWGVLQSILPADTRYEVTDLTGKPWVAAGYSDSKLGAYQWAWAYPQNHPGVPAFNSQVVFLLPSSTSNSSQVRTEIIDYLIAHRGFALEFNDVGEPTAEQITWAQNVVLPTYANNSNDLLGIAMGWFGLGGELTTITTLSSAGINMQGGWMPNLSLYTGLPIYSAAQHASDRTLSYDPNMTYVLVQYTQGDDIAYVAADMLGYWGASPADPNVTNLRQTIYKSWMLDVFATELLPPAVNFYMSTMSPRDSFVTGASGAGYAHPSSFNADAMSRYANAGKPRMDGLGIHVAWINDGGHQEFSSCAASPNYMSMLASYAQSFNKDTVSAGAPPSLQGILEIAPNYLCSPQILQSHVGSTQVTTPVMPDYKKWRVSDPATTGATLAAQLNQNMCANNACPQGAQAAGSHFIFVFLDFSARPAMLAELQSAWADVNGPAYNPRTTLVRSDEFLDLIMQQSNLCFYSGIKRSCVTPGQQQTCIMQDGNTVWSPCQ